MSQQTRSWRQLAAVGLSAAVTLAAADLGLGRLAPPPYQREVRDALEDLTTIRPDVLVLGSSHARSFDVVERIAREADPDGPRLIAVPLEFGRLGGYRWVLERRIEPLLDGTAPRHLVLVTEWWDSLPTAGRFEANIPSRAFSWADFGADLWEHGFDGLNRNFLQEQWREFWRGSALVQHRGTVGISAAIREALGRGRDPAEEARALEARLQSWQRMIEDGADQVLDPSQVEAMRAILGWARDRGIRTTVLLYPRKPATLTQQARDTTLVRFADAARELAREFGADFQDDTGTGLLTDAHYEADFDHLTREGHEIYARHLLETVLAGR
jgi:hypothetical protein